MATPLMLKWRKLLISFGQMELNLVERAIRRAGRWNTSSLTTAYLTNLPHELLRTLAGFPTERGYFYLSRANVQRPEKLCKKKSSNSLIIGVRN
ncbi:hypothetical protein INT45_010139 [Circinella minor]|uniref:Uncharacterized protein n=1 Tax=Circinella minor TaxID=1195481 RepID=A0A8H7SE02_9FUNG|nr:hypothetical protein INT45_010139 [Circinella minor]